MGSVIFAICVAAGLISASSILLYKKYHSGNSPKKEKYPIIILESKENPEITIEKLIEGGYMNNLAYKNKNLEDLTRDEIEEYLTSQGYQQLYKKRKPELLKLMVADMMGKPIGVVSYRGLTISVYNDDYGQCYEIVFFDKNGKLHASGCGTYNFDYEGYIRNYVDWLIEHPGKDID